ncbi:hypothetical protein BHYA_0119g00120 [Botrytis hyacinthi]|uniref:Heterokaryon incompatibility domain-containing protein n=1 Tax=Botrytis hyacinthi TaxID=278943 RepID=A0A4Z1GMD9_9HELO|nr:hypothetical protein BHYA_0119g00120 [Botrytis hyacinthi]
MGTSQLEAKSSVDDEYSALSEEDQHHLDALKHAEAVDLTEPDSLELSTPLPGKVKTQKLCRYCEPMFSTIENLQHLASEEGYKHNTKKGIRDAADRGCGLCKFIQASYSISQTVNSHMRVHAFLVEKRFEDRLPLFKRILMFVEEHLLPKLRRSAILAEYPFDGCKIDGLIINSSPGSTVNQLCLLADEDSDADKAKEIEAMGAIFKNATVTISAASATSVDGGLFNHGPTPELLEIPFCLPDKSLSKSLKYEPVAKSGYVYWQTASEVPANIFGRDVAIQLPGTFHRAQTWNSIVQEFTNGDLTNPEDRLPAISGIAKELALVWNDEHVFGVMRSTIEHHLSWGVPRSWSSHGKTLSNVRNGRVPSWSWVSVDFPVSFTRMDVDVHFRTTCLEIDNTPACGKIVVEAKVLSLEAHPMNSGQEKLLQEYYDVPEDLKAEACTLMLLGECEGKDEKSYGYILRFGAILRDDVSGTVYQGKMVAYVFVDLR